MVGKKNGRACAASIKSKRGNKEWGPDQDAKPLLKGRWVKTSHYTSPGGSKWQFIYCDYWRSCQTLSSFRSTQIFSAQKDFRIEMKFLGKFSKLFWFTESKIDAVVKRSWEISQFLFLTLSQFVNFTNQKSLKQN